MPANLENSEMATGLEKVSFPTLILDVEAFQVTATNLKPFKTPKGSICDP